MLSKIETRRFLKMLIVKHSLKCHWYKNQNKVLNDNPFAYTGLYDLLIIQAMAVLRKDNKIKKGKRKISVRQDVNLRLKKERLKEEIELFDEIQCDRLSEILAKDF